MDDVVKIIEKITALLGYQIQHLLSDSFGSLIAVDYLVNCDHPIKKVVLSSPYASVAELEAVLHEYIRYDNHDRIKLKLKGLSSVLYRSQSSKTP